MALSEIDRELLKRCLDRGPRAWEDFVDRFMGLVVHVVNHTAQCRSLQLTPHDRDDLIAEVFLTLVRDDLAVLRRFRGASSLATYLTVVARRVVVQRLVQQQRNTPLAGLAAAEQGSADSGLAGLENRDEIARMLGELEGLEAEVVRLRHLEGRSYREISETVGIPENSVGPTLSRALTKMRQAGADATTG